MNIEKELSALRQLMQQTVERLGAREQVLFKPKDAAKMMGISPTTLRRMVAGGELVMTPVHGRYMVSLSEIRRIAAPPRENAKSKPTRRSHGGKAPKGKTEAEKFRAMLKRA